MKIIIFKKFDLLNDTINVDILFSLFTSSPINIKLNWSG